MATSGSWNYSASATNIINAAMEDIGVLAAGETLSSDDAATGLKTLNYIAKQWQADPSMLPGISAVARKVVTLFLTKDKRQYLIGPNSSDDRATTQYGRTTLSADEASGQTTLSITANTDTTTYPGTTVTMTASDIVGVELDNGTIHWSTISGTPSTTMDIAAQLPSAAASGNYVWWFTSRAQRFVALESASLRDANLEDSPLSIIRNVADYESIIDKDADGTPTSILVEPLALNNRVTLNCDPDDRTKQLRLVVLYPAEDYDVGTNDIAFPAEAYAGLEWELAFRLAPKYGVPWTPLHQANHANAVGALKRLHPEVSDVYFQPGLE